MAVPLLAKLTAMAATKKENGGCLKKVVILVIAVIGFFIIILGGLFSTFFGSTFSAEPDDLYVMAKESVKARHAIENDLDVSILKLLDYTKSVTREDQSELEQYIEAWFILTEEQEPPPEESSEPSSGEAASSDPAQSEPPEPPSVTSTPETSEGGSSGSESSEEPPPLMVTRFKTLEEIMEMLRAEPFNLTDEEISDFASILAVGIGGGLIGDGLGDGQLAWPVPGIHQLGDDYGTRWHPIRHTYAMHNGIDIPAPTGTPVAACEAGTVIYAARHYSFGWLIRIDHGNGLHTWYAHNSFLQVSRGDTVQRGQQIALSGNSGDSTGPHVHLEVRVNGRAVDPKTYFIMP